jgi:hypothetical protein
MKRFIPLFEEFTGTHLLIVDVQESFAKWWKKNNKPNLVAEIKKYAEGFDNVYQIWDSNDNITGPTWKFPNEIKTLEKKYGPAFDQGVIDEFFDGEEKENIQSDFDNNSFEPKMYNAKDGSIYFYVGQSHDWFKAPKKLMEFFKYLKSLNTEIILVGGAEGECLEDLSTVLSIMEIPHRINPQYTYHA